MMSSSNRSISVTVVACVFIILAALTMVISILHMIPVQQMTESMKDAPAQDMQEVFRFLSPHFRFVSFSLLVISAITFVSAIGLLWRRNWGRVIFVVILALGIIGSLFGVVIQFIILVNPRFSPGPESGQSHLFFYIIQVFTLLIAIGIGMLFGWIIRKLNSAPIKAEFLGSPLAS